MKTLIIILVSIFLVSFVSALPTPILRTDSEWKVVTNTEIGYTPMIVNKNSKITLMCIYQNNATKLQDIKRGDLDFFVNSILSSEFKFTDLM
jgi:hypothetical protein